MNDPRLLHVLDHPPRDPERSPDAAFTAAVMARLPASAPPRLTDRGSDGPWWLAAVVAAAGSFLLPLDPVASIADWSRLIDAELAIELFAAAAILAAVLPAMAGPRRMRP